VVQLLKFRGIVGFSPRYLVFLQSLYFRIDFFEIFSIYLNLHTARCQDPQTRIEVVGKLPPTSYVQIHRLQRRHLTMWIVESGASRLQKIRQLTEFTKNSLSSREQERERRLKRGKLLMPSLLMGVSNPG
jgi:hypothetical protein